MQVIISISGHQHTFDINFAYLPVLLYQNIKNLNSTLLQQAEHLCVQCHTQIQTIAESIRGFLFWLNPLDLITVIIHYQDLMW